MRDDQGSGQKVYQLWSARTHVPISNCFSFNWVSQIFLSSDYLIHYSSGFEFDCGIQKWGYVYA